jgi:hypothetical protein
MANNIILKKSSVAAKVPVVGDLAFGELALNYTDGKLYYKKADGTSIDSFITSSGSITGNSGSVTNGVYTIGDQTIAGIKTFTSTLTSNVGGSAASEVASASFTNGAYALRAYPRLSNGSYNSLVQTGDTGLIFTTGTQNAGALVIAPWSNVSGGVGLRMTSDGNTTISGNLTSTGILKSDQILQGTNTFVRDYASGYNTTVSANTVYEIARLTFTGSFQNIAIVGEIRGGTGASVGVNRFILDLRSETLPTKSFTIFEEETTNLGRVINLRVYHDTASGLVVIGYLANSSLQNIGWSLRVQERGNYNYLQQATTLTPINTIGLTQVNLTSTVRTLSSSLVVDNGITGNLTGNAATATILQTARTINGVSFNGSANITVADSTKQPLDEDLTAIAALTGTSGLLRKTAADTWSLDTNTYVTSSGVTSVSGTAPIISSGGTAPAISISAATTSAAGSMSAADKTKLDGIASGATANTGTVTSVGGTGTVSGLTLTGTVTGSGNLTLGGTLSLTSGQVTTALGFTPYNATNPSGYITSSGSITGTSAGVIRTVTGTTSAELVRGNMGNNDHARILVGASADNAGYLEIATADDASEPIYIRQYTGVFTTLSRTATLLDASGNTQFPGTVSAAGVTLTGNTGDVTLTGTQTLSNKTFNAVVLNDGYTEEVFAVSSNTPALSPTNGSIQTWTLTANSTPTIGTWVDGQSVTLMIDDGTNFSITWPTISWTTTSASPPVLRTTGYTTVVLWEVGSVIYGKY